MFIYGHCRTALIREKGHPNQVLSLESHPICTSLNIHSPFSVLSPNPPALGPHRDSETLWCWSPVQLGLWGEDGNSSWRSPVPAASSPLGTAGGSVPTLGQLQALVPIPSRVWLQVIAPAAPGSPGLVLQTGNKSPRRSSHKVSIQAPPRGSRSRPQILVLVSPHTKAPLVFCSGCSEL